LTWIYGDMLKLLSPDGITHAFHPIRYCYRASRINY